MRRPNPSAVETIPLRRVLAFTLALSLLAVACGDAEATVAEATVAQTTPAPGVTTTLGTTPPATEPAVEVFITIPDASDDLLAQVTGLFEAVAGGATSAAVPAGLLSHVAGSGQPGLARELALHSATLPNGEVAVITDGTDIVLAAAPDGTHWSVVGAKLPSLGLDPWYGEQLRQVYIIGSDARPGENPLRFRADSHHVITITPDGKAASIVGIPRDSYVETPEGTFDKFTNVMASNGPERILGTAEILTGIDLEGYVVTGFKGFVNLVNAFGGFQLDIPFAMAEEKSQAYFSAGVQHLNGEEALAFARNRTIQGGDFTRQFHHGVIMQWAMVAVQAGGIEDLPRLLELLTTHTWTDLPAGDLLTLGALTYELEPFEVPNVVVEGDNASRGGAAVVVLRDSAFEVFASLAETPYAP